MNGCIYISHRDNNNSEPVTLSHCYEVQTISGKVFISQLVHV